MPFYDLAHGLQKQFVHIFTVAVGFTDVTDLLHM